MRLPEMSTRSMTPLARMAATVCLLALGYLSIISVARGTQQQPSTPNPYSCEDPARKPPREYPVKPYSRPHLVGMFVRPSNVAQLLHNLEEMYDRDLLAQPGFADEGVLLRVLGGVRSQSSAGPGPGANDIIQPTTVVSITLAPNILPDTIVEIGVQHQCIPAHPDADRPELQIPAHLYDSGYLRLHARATPALTVGLVKAAFGSRPLEFISDCHYTGYFSYRDANKSLRGARFESRSADFSPDPSEYQARCRSGQRPVFSDDMPIREIFIREIERDHTRSRMLAR
jgi:hypothetical protein